MRSHLGQLISVYLANADLPPEVELNFHWESEPLGTAGALAMVPDLDGTFIVMNGDVLTTLDYRKLLEVHREKDAALTVAMHNNDVHIDLGVIESEGSLVCNYIEKPTLHYQVSMGIYAYDERALQISPDGPCQFPDLVTRLLEAGERVAACPSDADWYDIGTLNEYERAAADVERFPDKYGMEPLRFPPPTPRPRMRAAARDARTSAWRWCTAPRADAGPPAASAWRRGSRRRQAHVRRRRRHARAGRPVAHLPVHRAADRAGLARARLLPRRANRLPRPASSDAQVPQDALGRPGPRPHVDGRRAPDAPRRVAGAHQARRASSALARATRRDEPGGPRPESPSHVDRVRREYQEILDVRPGLTGYSQLAFAEEPCILDRNDPQGHYFSALLPQKVALDRLYASRFGTRRDFKILIATIATLILRQPVAVNRTTGALSLRRRPVEPEPAMVQEAALVAGGALMSAPAVAPATNAPAEPC